MSRRHRTSQHLPDKPTFHRERDGFAVARDSFLLLLATTEFEKSSGPARVGIVLATCFANREIFEREGVLWAWPSIGNLATTARMFRGRVERALIILEEKGLVRIDRSRRNHRYALKTNVLTSEDDEKSPIVLGTVANENLENVLTSEDVSSSHARTDLHEETPEGAGALGARPAPVQEVDGVSICEDEETRHEDNGGAVSRAPVSPTVSLATVDPSDPDAWRSDPEFAEPASVNSKGAGCAPEGAPAPEPAADLPDDDDEVVEVVYLADPMPSGDVLADVMEEIHARVACDAPHRISASEFSREWYRGFVFGFPGPARIIASDTAQVVLRLSELEQIDPDEYMTVEEYRTDHLAAITRLARLTTADGTSAAVAVERYELAVGRQVANLKAKKGAVHA
jgi:hypothetical protein